MKRIFLITAFLLMISSSKNSRAQSNDVVVNHSTSPVKVKAIPHDKKRVAPMTKNVNVRMLKEFTLSNRISSEIKVTGVNIKAVRDFARSHKNISDAKWFKTEGGYLADFLSNGVYTKIVYDDKGSWLYNLLEYTEANLTYAIRHMVKRQYYDDEILVIHEYEFDNDKTVYIIRMQDKKSNIITISVCDGEIKDITQRKKN